MSHSTPLSIDATLEQWWHHNYFPQQKDVQQLRAQLRAHKGRLRAAQQRFAALTEYMLLRGSDQYAAAAALRTRWHKKFARMKDPLHQHRWKRLQAGETFQRGEFMQALEMGQQLCEESAQLGTLSDRMLCSVLLFHTHCVLGHFAQALHSMQDAHLLALQQKDAYTAAYAQHLRVNTYEVFGRNKEGLLEAEKVQQLYSHDYSQPLNLLFHNMVAGMRVQCGQHQQAATAFEQLLAYMQQHTPPSKAWIVGVQSNLAAAYLLSHQFEKSEAAFKAMFRLMNADTDPKFIIAPLINMAELYKLWYKPDKMLRAIRKGEKIAAAQPVLRYRLKLQELLGHYYSMTQQPAKALHHYQRYMRKFEEWKQIDDAEKIKALELRHALQLEHQQLEHQQQLNHAHQQQLQQQNSWLQQQQKLIAHLEQQFSTIEKSNVDKKEVFAQLKQVVRDVRQTQQQDMQVYSVQFNEQHAAAMHALQQKHPSVTNTEAKIAVMLARGLHNKEVANLNLITTRSVEYHRQALRTKMKLKRTDDLVQQLRKAIV